MLLFTLFLTNTETNFDSFLLSNEAGTPLEVYDSGAFFAAFYIFNWQKSWQILLRTCPRDCVKLHCPTSCIPNRPVSHTWHNHERARAHLQIHLSLNLAWKSNSVYTQAVSQTFEGLLKMSIKLACWLGPYPNFVGWHSAVTKQSFLPDLRDMPIWKCFLQSNADEAALARQLTQRGPTEQ